MVDKNFPKDLAKKQIQNKGQSESFTVETNDSDLLALQREESRKSRCVKIMLKFYRAAKERLFVLDDSIIQHEWLDSTMRGFSAIMATAHVDLTESYTRFFHGIKLEKSLDLNFSHSSNEILSHLRDWCTMIPVLSAGVVQRLNICVKHFSQTKFDTLAKADKFKKKEDKEFLAWYASDQNIFYAFPTSYYTVEYGRDRELTPLTPNDNVGWELWDGKLKDAVASRLLIKEYVLQNYSLVKVDLIDFAFRVVAQFVSAPVLLQVFYSEDKGAGWRLAMEPLEKVYDFERLVPVLDMLLIIGLEGGNLRVDLDKIPSLVLLVKETYPDTTTFSQSDFDVRVREEGIKIVDQCPALLELESFVQLVENSPTVFPVVSRLSSGGQGASTRQKVRFILSEYKNVVITTMAVSVVFQKIAAVPVSLETGGVLFLVETQDVEEFTRFVVESLDLVGGNLLGCTIPIEITFPSKPEE